jgi:hypothetical protein
VTLTVLVVSGQEEADPERWVGLVGESTALTIQCVQHSYAELSSIADRISAAIPVLADPASSWPQWASIS